MKKERLLLKLQGGVDLACDFLEGGCGVECAETAALPVMDENGRRALVTGSHALSRSLNSIILSIHERLPSTIAPVLDPKIFQHLPVFNLLVKQLREKCQDVELQIQNSELVIGDGRLAVDTRVAELGQPMPLLEGEPLLLELLDQCELEADRFVIALDI